MSSYKTVSKASECEIIEKKSRFISLTYPVTCEEEALSHLEAARKKYYDATHVVFAYRIRTNQIQRFSDDGEPQGTAGVPVLEVLSKGEITDTLSIVVRYFGGTLLGAGGLIRAYSKSAHEGVTASEVITMAECVEFIIDCPYHLFGTVEHILRKHDCRKIDVVYADQITMRYYIEEGCYQRLVADLTETTNATVSAKEINRNFYQL